MKHIKGFKNTHILTEDGIVKTNLIIKDGKIEKLGDYYCESLIELDEEKIVVPGFIDQHIHGANGFDVIDGTQEALSIMAQALAQEGTTGFLATTTTESPNCICKALQAVREYIKAAPDDGAEILGAHLEGPFISKDFLGAQLPEFAVLPDVKAFKCYEEASGGNIKLVSMAVESEGADDLVEYLISKGIVVSIGHSNAKYNEVAKAVAAGVTNVTHTYNAQSPIHHRELGVVGSAMLFDELYCEAICDGVHLSVPAVELLRKNKPDDKFVLITDSLRAKYLTDGVYPEPSGQVVTVKDGEARLDDGTLAGSTLKMNVAIKNIVKWFGTDIVTAIKYATENPARNLGIFHRVGSIKEGKLANLAIIDRDLNVYQTVRNGKTIYNK